MNRIVNPYIKDYKRCMTPVYVPYELYSFYINFDDPTNDVDFNNFRLDIYKNETAVSTNVGVLKKHVVKGLDLYNIYCEFRFPDLGNGQYYFVIYDRVKNIEKCRSNVILCERDLYATIAQPISYSHDEMLFNYYYDLLPDFKNKFRLPLAMVDYQYEMESTQYRNVSDNKLRNLYSVRDKVVKVESYNFDEPAHDAMSAVYEHLNVFIQNTGVTRKSAYQVTVNQNSNTSKGVIDVYLNGNVLDELFIDDGFDLMIVCGDQDLTEQTIYISQL